MSAYDLGETNVSPSDPSADSSPAAPVRPSWETAAPPVRPAASSRPRPVPGPAAAPSSAANALPYYAAPPSPVIPPVPAVTPIYEAETVRYDLAGNPIASAAPAQAAYTPAAAYAPPAPFGYSAGTAASWPPAVSGHGYGSFRNNSGEQDHIPPEIERLRWNWGAFFFPILWTKNHGLTTMAAMLGGGLLVLRLIRYLLQSISPLAFLGICAVYGVTYFAVQIYFGLNGHRIGWRNRHFSGGLDEYHKVQNAWMWWGLGINVAGWVILPMLLFMGALGLGLSAAHNRTYGNGYGSPYGSGYSRPYSSWPQSGTPVSTGGPGAAGDGRVGGAGFSSP